jgi:hypothetical protein
MKNRYIYIAGRVQMNKKGRREGVRTKQALQHGLSERLKAVS